MNFVHKKIKGLKCEILSVRTGEDKKPVETNLATYIQLPVLFIWDKECKRLNSGSYSIFFSFLFRYQAGLVQRCLSSVSVNMLFASSIESE